jgi:hypothetical protein
MYLNAFQFLILVILENILIDLINNNLIFLYIILINSKSKSINICSLIIKELYNIIIKLYNNINYYEIY